MDQCSAVVYSGSRNPDSAAFGPDEYCENDATCGEFCDSHEYLSDPEGWLADEPDYDQED